MTSPGNTNEYAGFSRSLLYGGAKSALLTFWSVNAISTLMWMEKFYGLLGNAHDEQPLSKSTAFKQATMELQEEMPPYYWAPFFLVGDWR